MANLLQYMRTTDHPKNINRIENYYYLCGSVRRGVEIVYQDILRKIRPSSIDFSAFMLSEDSFSDVFDALALSTKTRRAVVVREADLLKESQWQRIFTWAQRPGLTSLIVMTDEDDPRKTENVNRFRWFAKEGKFVECKPFSDKEKASEFVQLYLGVTEYVASFIIERVGYDADHLLGELEKMKIAGIDNIRDLKDSLRASPSGDLVDALYRGDPRLLTLDLDEEFLAFLGLLELDLVRQAAVIGLQRQVLPLHEIAKRASIPMFVIRTITMRAMATNAQQLAGRLDLVTRAQKMYRTGAVRGLKDWFLRSWRRT